MTVLAIHWRLVLIREIDLTWRNARPHLLLDSSRNVPFTILVLLQALCFLFHELDDLLVGGQMIFEFDGQNLILLYQGELLAEEVVLLYG